MQTTVTVLISFVALGLFMTLRTTNSLVVERLKLKAQKFISSHQRGGNIRLPPSPLIETRKDPI